MREITNILVVLEPREEDLVAEFVVMGNVSRETLAGLSIGSTAETILDQIHTNVLVVRVSETSG